MRRSSLVLVVLIAAAGALATIGSAMDVPRVQVSVDRSNVIGASSLTLGVTHTQYSLDPWGDQAAVRRGKKLLAFAGYQNQHLYGWGAANPEPSPGKFRWRTLDRRMKLMRSMGATPVITLCCAPDWMTRLGSSTSTFPTLPPLPKHYDDFAELARRVALRYPDVRHFMVWNEMKGLWDPVRDRWDAPAYTELYNRVYAALKSVNSEIKVGGPYLVIEGTGAGPLAGASKATASPITPRDRAVLDYWLANKAGADFVAIDRRVQGSHDPNRYAPRDLLGLTSWFGAIARQVRTMTDLPIWYAEDYFVNVVDAPDRRYQAAGLASMLAAEVRGGVATSLRWHPQGVRGARGANYESLFTDTRRRGGGKPYPAWRVYDLFARWFKPGTKLVKTTGGAPDVDVLASPRVTLLINHDDVDVDVDVDGRRIRLDPYAVRLVAARPASR